MSDTPELLPCPFCGGEATFFGEALCFSVRCTKCDGNVTRVLGTYEQAEIAVGEWNRRADTALGAEAMKRVAERHWWAGFKAAVDQVESMHGSIPMTQSLILTALRITLSKAPSPSPADLLAEALEVVIEKMSKEHDAYMRARGRNPLDYSSKYSMAADVLSALAALKGADHA